MTYEMNYTKFLSLSNDEKENYISMIKRLYLDELYSRDELATKINVSQGFLKKLFKDYNIKKSKEQLSLTSKQTCLKKYGVESTNQIDVVKEKQHGYKTEEEKQKRLEKYKQTCLEKYGVENAFQSEEKKAKIKQTNLKKYGTEYPSQCQEIKDKIKQTNLKKYGHECAMNAKTLSEDWQNDYKQKYGVTWPSKRDDYKERVSKKCQEKYGVKWYCMLPQCRFNGGAISKINQRFADILQKNNISFEQEFNLENYSYDFKIGNILVEINPTYTHNSTKAAIFRDSKHQFHIKDKYYHQDKSKVAQENGFRCIHVFDWDDINKIINMLKEKEIIYARNCEIKEVNKKDCNTFLILYHLQNSCIGQKFCYGLYYNNMLVQIMTFGKPRYNKNYEWELLRLCSHKDYKVVGGSKKLFKYFLKNVKPQSIISYCDDAKFSGDVYKQLGFSLKSKGKPSCIWSKGKEKITDNLLRQRGYDQLFETDYGKGTSNRNLMIKNGWREVYDCGQDTWTMNNL